MSLQAMNRNKARRLNWSGVIASLHWQDIWIRSGSWHFKRLSVFFTRLRIHCQADINYLMSPSPIRLSFPMQGQISRNFYCCVILLNTRTCNVNYHWVLRGLAPHTVLNWREYINFKDKCLFLVQCKNWEVTKLQNRTGPKKAEHLYSSYEEVARIDCFRDGCGHISRQLFAFLTNIRHRTKTL